MEPMDGSNAQPNHDAGGCMDMMCEMDRVRESATRIMAFGKDKEMRALAGEMYDSAGAMNDRTKAWLESRAK